ncbi:4-hydroxy-tetrahydrodipicolinate reductase [Protaetiibacter intestinalis]|uniref:4-hydroxy-tetrahydrodipicolinate reductase n=1 Tax=Protaetiibacter intestinalis TaxID=2419774 RepID=A0A387B6X6_9MICO|nr:4-hydroxy-tetrahydrodipicolinate reductase [Protaetiibacter intestinalis]AYF96826.1 4-hydroxy-tetrahydrodipicolinate reductase [Protaetiibacter intestinalis]
MAYAVAVVGATGRMGTLAIRLIEQADDLEVHAALGSADPIDAIEGADLVLDLTLPAVSPGIVDAAIARGIPVLVGTSGWTAERLARVRSRLGDDPQQGVIVIPNFSLGSVLATRLATIAAPWFDSIEIIEAHHAGKSDSPSGTAIRTAELIAEARAEQGPVAAPHADQRARGQQVASVPVHSLRMDGVLAEQQVIFGGTGETLRVSHQTVSDASYEAGILLALRALPATRGLVVGLDTLLGLDRA